MNLLAITASDAGIIAGSLAYLLLWLICIYLGILALCLPWFIYSIWRHIKLQTEHLAYLSKSAEIHMNYLHTQTRQPQPQPRTLARKP